MITIRFSGRQPSPEQSRIGMEADQRAETLRFLLPQIADDQSAQLMMLLPDGTADMLQIRDGLASVPARVTEIPGRCRCWVEILGGEKVAWNSELIYLDIGDLPPISERTEAQYPTAVQDAMEACAMAERYRDQANEERLLAQRAALNAIAAGGLVYFEINSVGDLIMRGSIGLPYAFEINERGELVYYAKQS